MGSFPFQAHALSARENHSDKRSHEKEARARTWRGTPTFRFCVSGLTWPIVGWTKCVFAHNRAGNCEIPAIGWWKSLAPCDEWTESSRRRTYYCANGILGAVWWNIVECEILPNNFPWHVGSPQSPRVSCVHWPTRGLGGDFSFQLQSS